MLRAVPRWSCSGDVPIVGASAANRGGGAVVVDARNQVSLLDDKGVAIWTRTAGDTVRAVRCPVDGRGAFVLTTSELTRFGFTGKAIWRTAAPLFPLDLAVRRNGTACAASGSDGLVRAYSAAGRQIRARRLFHPADHLAISERSTEVVVVSARGDVSLLDANGEPAWHVNLGCVAYPPDLSDERIAIPSFDGVYAFRPDGTPAGVYDVQAPCLRAFFGNGGKTLLVQDVRQRLLLLDVETGSTLWHMALSEDPKDVSFSWDGSSIVMVTRAGMVEKLGLGDDRVAVTAPARPRTPGRDTLEFLEVGGGSVASKVEPKVRWRVRTGEAGSVDLVILKGGSGVAMLDRTRGALSFWSGGTEPSWRAVGLGADAILGAARIGHPLVVADREGVRFFRGDGSESARADLAANALAVADSGMAVLVGTVEGQLHLFDGTGKPVWDAPTGGFSRIGISPRGMELAVARADGLVAFHVRGQRAGTAPQGFSSDLTPENPARTGEPERVVTRPGQVYQAVGQFAAPEGDLEIAVFDDGLAYGTRHGKAGFVATDGTVRFEEVLPGGRPIRKVLRVGHHETVLNDEGGRWFRMRRDPWRLVEIGGSTGHQGARRSRATSREPDGSPKDRPRADRSGRSEFALAMDHLLEFRYDSREIGCLEADSGAVLWRRALDEMPRAVAVTADGGAIAAHVSGELVLYDLSPAAPKAHAAPRFLEL